VATYVTGAPGAVVAEYEEVGSGSRDDRPQLALALAACRAHRAVLVIAKLDRLACNAAFLLAIVDGAGPGGIVFCDLPEVPAGAVGKFFITLMAAVTDLERGLISQRAKAALAVAKARGVKLGGPNMGRGFDTAMSRAGH
jgi:DNA invertase Pin-like site-specific DNA recombinase